MVVGAEIRRCHMKDCQFIYQGNVLASKWPVLMRNAKLSSFEADGSNTMRTNAMGTNWAVNSAERRTYQRTRLSSTAALGASRARSKVKTKSYKLKIKPSHNSTKRLIKFYKSWETNNLKWSSKLWESQFRLHNRTSKEMELDHYYHLLNRCPLSPNPSKFLTMQLL